MIATIEVEIHPGLTVRATGNVAPWDGCDGSELAIDGYPTIVCADWGHPVTLPAHHASDVEAKLVDEAKRQIARISDAY